LKIRGQNIRRSVAGCALGVALALAGCAALPAIAGAQTSPTRDVLFVGNSSAGTVDVFDVTTFQKLETINVIPDGNTPQDPLQALAYPTLTAKVGINYVQDIALSPDARTLYVSRGYLGDVAAFDAARRCIPSCGELRSTASEPTTRNCHRTASGCSSRR